MHWCQPATVAKSRSTVTPTTSRNSLEEYTPTAKIPRLEAPGPSKNPQTWTLMWENLGKGIAKEEISLRFGNFGKILHLNVHQSYPGSKVEVVYETQKAMEDAYKGLNGEVIWNQQMILTMQEKPASVQGNLQEPVQSIPEYDPSNPQPSEIIHLKTVPLAPINEEPKIKWEESGLSSELYAAIGIVIMAKYSDPTLPNCDLTVNNQELITLLEGSEQITANTLDFYFALLHKRSMYVRSFSVVNLEENQNTPPWPKTWFFNTKLMVYYMEGNQQGLKDLTKSIDIFTYDLVLFPVPLTSQGQVCVVDELDKHYVLVAIDIRTKVVASYSTLELATPGFHTQILNFLDQHHLEKKKTPLNRADFLLRRREVPKYGMEKFFCGIFTAEYAERLASNKDIKISSDIIPIKRAQMTHEIMIQQVARIE